MMLKRPAWRRSEGVCMGMVAASQIQMVLKTRIDRNFEMEKQRESE
jgi:hypothetical protein